MVVLDSAVHIPGCRGCTGGDVRGLGLGRRRGRYSGLAGFLSFGDVASTSAIINAATSQAGAAQRFQAALAAKRADLLAGNDIDAPVPPPPPIPPPPPCPTGWSMSELPDHSVWCCPPDSTRKVMNGKVVCTAPNPFAPNSPIILVASSVDRAQMEVRQQAIALQQKAAAGDWNAYCQVNYTDPAVIAACQKCPTSVFGNCISPPPWTEVGAAMRGIPKAHGSISWGAQALADVAKVVGTALTPPDPADYDPKKLLVTAYLDPGKFVQLTAWASLVPGIGTAYMLNFVPIANPLGIGLAFAACGADFDAFFNIDGKVLIDEAWDAAQVIVDFLLSGPSIAAVKYILRRLNETITDPRAKAVVAALLLIGDDVFLAIRDPKRFIHAPFWMQLGQSFNQIAGQIADPQVKQDVQTIADVFTEMISPILDLIDPSIQGDRLLKAFDDLTLGVFKVPWSQVESLQFSPAQLAALPVDQTSVNIWMNANTAIAAFLHGVQGIGKDIGLKHVVDAFNGIPNELQTLANMLHDKILLVQQAKAAMAAAAAAPPPPSTPPPQIPPFLAPGPVVGAAPGRSTLPWLLGGGLLLLLLTGRK